MAIQLTAVMSVREVVITFGTDAVVAVIPMTDSQVYRVTNTGETADEVAAEVAAEWLSQRLGVGV